MVTIRAVTERLIILSRQCLKSYVFSNAKNYLMIYVLKVHKYEVLLKHKSYDISYALPRIYNSKP